MIFCLFFRDGRRNGNAMAMQWPQQRRGDSGQRGGGIGSVRVAAAARQRLWRRWLQRSCGGQQGGRAAAAVAAREQQRQRGNDGGSVVVAAAAARRRRWWRWRWWPAWQHCGSVAVARCLWQWHRCGKCGQRSVGGGSSALTAACSALAAQWRRTLPQQLPRLLYCHQ
jgi:hypothetical protein